MDRGRIPKFSKANALRKGRGSKISILILNKGIKHLNFFACICSYPRQAEHVGLEHLSEEFGFTLSLMGSPGKS